MNSRLRLFGLFLFAAAVTGCAQARDPAAADAIAKSEAEAGRWLALSDAGNYSATWNEAAGLFQANVPKETWERQITGVRGPLGALVSRQASSRKYRTAMPGAPDGQYVIIQFRSSFEKKKQADETVTVMRETNNAWRVTGYFIR